MNWITQLLSRRAIDRDLAEEIRSHIEERAEELAKDGMDPREAQSTARREFGNPTLMEERGRDVWRWPLIEDLFSDVAYALRQLRKAPAFALAAIATLALGIGANTAVFSVVDAVLLKPLPYPAPDRLVSVAMHDIRGGGHPNPLSYPTFFDFRSSNHVFEHLACYRDDELGLSGAGDPVNLHAEIVSWDLFDVLRTRLEAGRGFLPDEEKAGTHVVVLSHRIWAERFGSDRSLVGRAITLNRQPYTVVGVAPAGFRFPLRRRDVEAWTTLALDGGAATDTPMTMQRGSLILEAIGRLKPGVRIKQAETEMSGIVGRLAREYPDDYKNTPSTYVRPEVETIAGDIRQAFPILLGAVGLVLLVACANVANLLLARTAEREREFAVRASLGAGRGRIVRQLLAESVTFALLGAVASIAVAAGALRIAVPLAGKSIPRLENAAIDARVLGASLVLAILTSVLFSLAPAWRLARMPLVRPLKEGGRANAGHKDRIRATLVVAQVALGLVLLSGAGLLGTSFLNLIRRDVGFRPQGLISFSVGVPNEMESHGGFLPFYARILDRLNALPGVVGSASTIILPLSGDRMTVGFNIEERPVAGPEWPSSDITMVSPSYFATLGLPALAGRTFTDRDDLNAPQVVVVNRAFANRFFPGENPIGKRIHPGAGGPGSEPQMREIVGMVGNARQSATSAAPEPIYYLPIRQMRWCCSSMIVRTAGPPQALESSIRAVVASIDPQAPVSEMRTIEDYFSEGVGKPRFQAMLLGCFAALALALTAIGLYGILAYSVVRRAREIGLRIALGATRASVVKMVMREAVTLVGAGIVLGTAGAFAANRLAGKLAVTSTLSQPVLVAIAVAVIAATAALAAYLPARRAASIDPMEALRSE